VVVLVSREARQVEHDHEVHAAFVQPAVREQVLKLAAIRGLGALAFLVEPFENFVALAAAVLPGAKLRGCGVTPTPKRVTEVEREDRVSVCDRSTGC